MNIQLWRPLRHSSAIRTIRCLAMIFATLAVLSIPAWADSVYIQYGDGRVIYVPRTSSRTYINNGGVIVNRLPTGYVSYPYAYSNGYPTYYTSTYWHKHNRYWKNDPAYNNGNNGNHYGNNKGNNGNHNGNQGGNNGNHTP